MAVPSLVETCPVALRRIFEDEENTAAVEIYLCFFHNVGCVFDHLVKNWMKQSSASQMCTGKSESSK